MKELAQYKRIQEETAAIIESLQNQLKEYMTARGLDTLTGDEHKATYKAITSSRIDTTALKKEAPEIAKRFTVATSSRRFTFA